MLRQIGSRCQQFAPFRADALSMAESAAHLVDQVITLVPVRQRVLLFPIPLGPRAGQKVLSLSTVPGRNEKDTRARRV